MADFLIGIVALAALLFGARHWGRQGERNRAKEQDRDRAKDIRRRADAARGLQSSNRGYRD